MKLDDVLLYPALNELRQQMGTDQLGDFRLFDPQKMLNYSERESLEKAQLRLSAADLKVQKDKTLAYKNSRLWVEHDDKFHLAYCEQMQSVRHRQKTVRCGSEQPSEELEVCLQCLSLLHYEGVDARRIRRNEFTEQVQERFDLDEFKQQFPFYPLMSSIR